jgi:hypothetical protein
MVDYEFSFELELPWHIFLLTIVAMLMNSHLQMFANWL